MGLSTTLRKFQACCHREKAEELAIKFWQLTEKAASQMGKGFVCLFAYKNIYVYIIRDLQREVSPLLLDCNVVLDDL